MPWLRFVQIFLMFMIRWWQSLQNINNKTTTGTKHNHSFQDFLQKIFMFCLIISFLWFGWIIEIKYLKYLIYRPIQINNKLKYRSIVLHAIPCHAIPCHAMPCHAMPCHTIPYHTLTYHTISYHTMPYHFIPYWYCNSGSCNR